MVDAAQEPAPTDAEATPTRRRPIGRAVSGALAGAFGENVSEAVSDAVGELVANTVRRVGGLAEALERLDPSAQDDSPGAPPGPIASAWAVAKAAGMVATAPIGLPTLAVAARRTSNDCLERIEAFPDHVLALAEGRPTDLPAHRVRRLDADERWLITSDVHRCVPGRTDWPGRQQTKDLYPAVLEHYAEDGWGLIENGDLEDFWLVGGSARGAVYDIARIAGGVAAVFDDGVQEALFADQLDRIVENNTRSIEVVRDGFLAEGRYHRTVGNHDEVYDSPDMIAALQRHLPGVVPVDSLLLTDGGDGAPQRLDAVAALVTHGHLTDSWNGPGYSPLGRAITWLALGLDDLPAPQQSDEALADEQAVERLLAGRGRNRLITLDPRFGGNRRFDSLDEERLFARLAEAADELGLADGWPWMVFGHTHYPMLRPTTRAGGDVRYANSGSGVLERAVTALEWDRSAAADGEDPIRLVLWTEGDRGPECCELVPDRGSLRAVPRG